MEKILIIGVDMLAGSNLASALAGEEEVIGISRRKNFSLSNCHVIAGEGFKPEELGDVIAAEQPQWSIYCGPASRSSWDWRDDSDSLAESKCIAAAAQAMAAIDRRLTLISTDAVFHGPHLFARESFSPSDRPIAGAIRRMEQAAAETGALVVRTHLFGWSPDGDSFAENMWASIADGRSVDATGNHYASPLLATEFSRLLWMAMRKGLAGIYHLAGAERVSMWQFAQMMVECSGPATDGCSKQQSLGLQPHVCHAEETSLDSRKIQRVLRTPLPRLRESIFKFIAQANSGHRNQIQGAAVQSRQPVAA